ncbi:hypothetical protein SNE35_02840 [Paucibacter sp. R3-3]|uniref:SPOR domain-containing protein n=1 Tax=Roseateles agri TaxID=3098619 RepID=A0ABU5DAZ5_9BURK|nr:hypothetical protein [Paucibacter sp. R3-3]MDY0743419.1 hypothetical protein [Paucibacter sp. R3-3]
MLRTLVVLLVVVNALFFGWTRGWLDSVVGVKASGDSEPERQARQLHPERIQILGAQAAAALQQRSCLEYAGALDNEAALQAAQAALGKVGVTNAAASTSDLPGQWVVATIKLGTKDFRDRKEETYKRLHIAFEPLTGVAADELPSLVLGRYASAGAAQAALDGFEARALKGLRVMQLQAPAKHYGLQIAEADGALQARLKAAAAKDPALAGGFKACTATTGTAAAASSAASGN